MTRKFAVLLTGLILVGAAPALALGPLDVDAAVGVHSKYVWRGQIVTSEAVMQPELNLGVMGFTVGVWGNVDLTDVNGHETSLSETNWTLGYELSLPIVSLGAGFIMYDFPSSGPHDTSEFYIGGKANVLLSPHLYIYNDIDQIKGTYVTLGGTWSHKLGESMGLELDGDYGWGSDSYMRGYFSVPTAGSSDLTFAARLPWHVVPMFTIEAHVSYATLLGDAKTVTDARDADFDTVFYGLTARFSF